MWVISIVTLLVNPLTTHEPPSWAGENLGCEQPAGHREGRDRLGSKHAEDGGLPWTLTPSPSPEPLNANLLNPRP